MKDFDFEEIDQAVSSVLDKRTRGETITREAMPSSTPVESREVSPAVRRTSGRFMDVMHPSSDMRQASLSRETSKPVDTPLPSPQFEEDETEEAAPETPFLADAVVEKRPLGSMPPAGGDIPESLEALLKEPEQDLLEEGEETPLLEAEAEDHEIMAMTPPAMPVIEPVEETSSTPFTETHEPQQSESVAPPQSLYDTEIYHQPVAGTPKKKSGFWVFLWIFLLIVLGAAAGAGVYFYVLPQL